MIDELTKYKIAAEMFEKHFKDFMRMSVEDVRDSAPRTASDCIEIASILFDTFHEAVKEKMPSVHKVVNESSIKSQVFGDACDEEEPLN